MSKKTNLQLRQTMQNSANVISGAYTANLIYALYSDNQTAADMDDLYFGIAALYKTDQVKKAFHLICGLYAIIGSRCPYPIVALESLEAAKDAFVAEFIADFYEIIDEKRLEEEENK